MRDIITQEYKLFPSKFPLIISSPAVQSCAELRFLLMPPLKHIVSIFSSTKGSFFQVLSSFFNNIVSLKLTCLAFNFNVSQSLTMLLTDYLTQILVPQDWILLISTKSFPKMVIFLC